MLLRRMVLPAAIIILSAVNAFCADTWMGRYNPEQTGYTLEKIGSPLVLKWEYSGSKLEKTPAAPILVGKTCYFASGDRMFATDADTGSLRWKYPADKGLAGNIRVTPAYQDGYIYFGAGDGNIYCLKASTGVLQWVHQTQGPIRCSPVIVDGVLYIGSDDNSIYALDIKTGNSVWPKSVVGKDDMAGSMAVSSGMVVASCMDGIMYGVNAATGKLKWNYRLPAVPMDNTPVISEGLILMAAGNAVYGITLRSGSLRWTLNLPSDILGTPATDGTTMYIPTRDNKLYAYDFTTRGTKSKWAKPIDIGQLPGAGPVVAGNTIYVVGLTGLIAAYSTEDGKLLWRYITSAAVTTDSIERALISSTPVISNGNLLVMSEDGVLHCFTVDAPDNEAPIALDLTPEDNKHTDGTPPIKMSAVLYDQGCGVDFSSLSFTFDDRAVEYITDLRTGTVTYTLKAVPKVFPVALLADGPHYIKITVKDYLGNTLTKQWKFIADSLLPADYTTEPGTETDGEETVPPPPPGMSLPGSESSGGDIPPPPPPPPMPAPGGSGMGPGTP